MHLPKSSASFILMGRIGGTVAPASEAHTFYSGALFKEGDFED
jgi:hypothetical protein